MINDNEDFELIHSYQQGDEQAFAKLFRKYYPAVYRILLVKGIPRNEAEDLTEEIFIKLISALKSFRFDKSFQNFLRRIVRNKIFDFYRKKQIKWYSLDFCPLSSLKTDSLPLTELEEIIEQCLQKITSLVRRSIILLWLEGYKRKQIAQILDLPLGTIHSNLERGKIEFRKCIKDKLL